jgi:hypothetical protein
LPQSSALPQSPGCVPFTPNALPPPPRSPHPSSTPKGFIITNQGTGGNPQSAVTTTLPMSLVLGSTVPCSSQLTQSVADTTRASLLKGNPGMTSETSVAPGDCTQLTINASAYAVVGSTLYVYAWDKVYAGPLSAQALGAFPAGGTLKIKGVNDGGRRLLAAADEEEGVVDPAGGFEAMDEDTTHSIARSLLQLKALFAVQITFSVNIIVRWRALRA